MSALRVAIVATLTAALAACGTARKSESAEASTCVACHGGADNQTGAPPLDTAGDGATTLVTVGAHTRHLAAGVACTACHVVPARTDSPGHLDTPPAEVIFAGLALVTGGPAPAWDRGTATCSGVYCHGAGFQGASAGADRTPLWTGSLAGGCGACHSAQPTGHPALAVSDCFTCHGASVNADGTIKAGGSHVDGTIQAVVPPSSCVICHATTPAGHGDFAFTDCATCHGTSVNADGTIKAGGTHLDGTVEFSLDASTCTECHGDAARVVTVQLNRSAPPPPAGGSHRDHLEGADAFFWNGGACAECHPTPIGSTHDYTVQVAFNGPLGTRGTTPSWDGASCSSVYCHGATLPGARTPNPTWGGVVGCGDCHFAGSPPPPHTATDTTGAPITSITQCYQCHATTVAPTGTILKAGGKHVNGTIDLAVP